VSHMPVVLDACALIAFLRGEQGSDVIESYFLDESLTCLAHAVNISEVYYIFARDGGEVVASQAMEDLRSTGLVVREEMDDALLRSVAFLKAKLMRGGSQISLADCYAAALAQRVGATVVTSDHREFGPVADQGFCRVDFFR
jgi:predicted nucleic acid-binding protein